MLNPKKLGGKKGDPKGKKVRRRITKKEG